MRVDADRSLRRTFLRYGAVALALVAAKGTAQVPKAPRRIGFLLPTTQASSEPRFNLFRARLKELGYVEGRDIVIDARWGDGDPKRYPTLARELLAFNPEVMVAPTIAGAQAAKSVTQTVPIVFFAVGDPVAAGFVASLGRPGGNMTGLSWHDAAMRAKLQEILREAMPERRKLALLVGENSVLRASVPERKKRLASMGWESEFFFVEQQDDLGRAFREIVRWRAEILWAGPEPLLVSHARKINDLAMEARLPLVGTRRSFTEAGGLLTYDNDVGEDYRRAAAYVDRILKGAKAGDLPVEQPERFHLIVNLRTAKHLGIKIPQTIVLRADQLIE